MKIIAQPLSISTLLFTALPPLAKPNKKPACRKTQVSRPKVENYLLAGRFVLGRKCSVNQTFSGWKVQLRGGCVVSVWLNSDLFSFAFGNVIISPSKLHLSAKIMHVLLYKWKNYCYYANTEGYHICMQKEKKKNPICNKLIIPMWQRGLMSII